LVACALATVACTAMIYASLKPIPAWRHALVLPVYLLFALVCGGWWWLALRAFAAPVPVLPVALGAAASVALGLCKWRYWHAIDTTALPLTRGDAVGLPQRDVALFERPITESNYVTREMAFLLARKHARRLRALALALLVPVPVVFALLAAWAPELQPVLLTAAALSALIGAFAERWLFFAQARHLVTLYY
jgi:DMSO reductase anchor subunit